MKKSRICLSNRCTEALKILARCTLILKFCYWQNQSVEKNLSKNTNRVQKIHCKKKLVKTQYLRFPKYFNEFFSKLVIMDCVLNNWQPIRFEVIRHVTLLIVDLTIFLT